MFCKNCGKEIDNNADICIHCGVKTNAELPFAKPEKPVFCTHCGNQIDPYAYVCVHCGRIVESVIAEEKQKAPLTTGALVFGILSLIFSLITASLIGVCFAIIGMSIAIKKQNSKGIALNIVAICFGVLMSIFRIAMVLLL